MVIDAYLSVCHFRYDCMSVCMSFGVIVSVRSEIVILCHNNFVATSGTGRLICDPIPIAGANTSIPHEG